MRVLLAGDTIGWVDKARNVHPIMSGFLGLVQEPICFLYGLFKLRWIVNWCNPKANGQ